MPNVLVTGQWISTRWFLAAALIFAAIRSPEAQDSAISQAHRGHAPNAIFVEILGNGGLYSLNYDRSLSNAISVRGGYTKWSSVDLGDQPTKHYMFYLLMLNGLLGQTPHRFEIGGGARFGRVEEENTPGAKSALKVTSTFGYRYQQPSQGWLFRCGFVPEYAVRGYSSRSLSFNVGVSAGHSF